MALNRKTALTSQRRTTTVFFLAILLVAALTLAAVSGLLYRLESRHRLDLVAQEEKAAILQQQQLIASVFFNIKADLAFLANQNELFQLFDSNGTPRRRQELAGEYISLMRSTGAYDQIRFIDTAGLEVVRVNDNDGAPAMVPEQLLQQKGDRPYFRESITLRQNELYISPFDLNVENNRIELPYKPVIRFATPVFDAAGRKRGVLILNYLGSRLLLSLQAASANVKGDMMLLNADGYWLSCPDPEKEWGFMFAEKRDYRFAASYPNLWPQISQRQSGQLLTPEGMFTFATVYPAASQSIFVKDNGQTDAWKVVAYISPDRLDSEVIGLRANLLLFTLILFVAAIIPVWLIAQAITRRRYYRLELERLAHYDILTGLTNRTLFHDRLQQAIIQAERYQRHFALLYIDLDGFKAVNDSHGHEAGDMLLKNVADRLKSLVRLSDTVGRMGGDEFTIILINLTDRADAEHVAAKIIDALSKPFLIKDLEIRIGASVGISIYPHDGRDMTLLLKQADNAMYQAKMGGKNRFRFAADP